MILNTQGIGPDKGKLKIILFSEGIKANKGVLTPATLIVDCRILAHPAALQADTKLDGGLEKWIVKNNWAEMVTITDLIHEGLDKTLMRRNGKKDPYEEPFTINFFCAHGMHRSVSAKNYMAGVLKDTGWKVEVK